MKNAALLVLCTAVICFGCNSYETKYPYTLKDFKPKVQTILEKIALNNTFPSSYKDDLENVTTKEDLKKLIKFQHQAIRVNAFEILIRKDSNYVKKIFKDLLIDTAEVIYSAGEFGVYPRYCIDFYISTINDYSNFLKNDTIGNFFISKFPRLEYTYHLITFNQFQTKQNYPYIKEMAVNSNKEYSDIGNISYVGYEGMHKSQISALSLSNYKSKDDLEFLNENLHFPSKTSLKIIQNFPDTSFLKTIEEFYKKILLAKKYDIRQFEIQKFNRQSIPEIYEDFLKAIVVFKNKRSATMLEGIIHYELIPYFLKNNYEKYKVMIYELMKTNYCKEYEPLIQKLKLIAEPIIKRNKATITL